MPDKSNEHCETYVKLIAEKLARPGHSIEPPATIDFEALAKGSSCVNIILNGEVYRLQRTRNHRLILTK